MKCNDKLHLSGSPGRAGTTARGQGGTREQLQLLHSPRGSHLPPATSLSAGWERWYRVQGEGRPLWYPRAGDAFINDSQEESGLMTPEKFGEISAAPMALLWADLSVNLWGWDRGEFFIALIQSLMIPCVSTNTHVVATVFRPAVIE